MGWTPLDEGLLTSTLLAKGPTPVAIWALLLASSDRYGVSKLTPSAAASLLRIPDEESIRAFESLQGNDPQSRNPAHNGKRIVRTEEGYWALVSFDKYRKITSKTNAAERQRKYVERKKERDKVVEPEAAEAVK
jgi:hypothetical protein